MKFDLKDRMKSFSYAFNGLKTLIRTQHNTWIHLAASIIIVVLGIIYELTKLDWALIIFSITLVWMAEALNTAIEFLADAVTKEFHPLIEKAKDVAAAAVLIAALGAVTIATLVFTPLLFL